MKCFLGSEQVLCRYSYIHLKRVKNPEKPQVLITCNYEVLVIKKAQNKTPVPGIEKVVFILKQEQIILFF